MRTRFDGEFDSHTLGFELLGSGDQDAAVAATEIEDGFARFDDGQVQHAIHDRLRGVDRRERDSGNGPAAHAEAGVWPATGSRPSQNKAIPKRMSYSEEDVPDRRPCFVFTIRETISVTANHKSLGLLIVYS